MKFLDDAMAVTHMLNKKSIILVFFMLVICFINNNIIRCDTLDNVCPRIMHQVFDGYAPIGNSKAGNYSEHENEKTLWPCVAECCKLGPECNVAFIYNDTCYHVKCVSNELCLPMKRNNLTKSIRLQLLLVNPVTDDAWIDILRKNHFADFGVLQQQQQLEKTMSIYNQNNNDKYEGQDSPYSLPGVNYDLSRSSTPFGRKQNLNEFYGLEHFTNDNEYINDEPSDLQGDVDQKYFTVCEIGVDGLCGAYEECRQLLPSSRQGVCNCKPNFVRLENGKCVSKFKSANPIDAIAQKLLMKNIQNFNGEAGDDDIKSSINPTNADPAAADPAITPLTVSVVSKDVRLPENEVQLSVFVMPEESMSGDKYTYLWTLIEQPPGAVNGTMQDQTKDKVKLSNLSAGLYRFKVSVTGKSSYGEATANVTVMPIQKPNTPPHAIITPKEQTVKLPNNKAILDGSGSSDDEKIEHWLWELVQGPIGYQPLLLDTSTLELEDLTLAGNYTFKLTVKDTDQAIDSTTAVIQVLKEIDYPPEANAGMDVIIYLPHNNITLNGTLSKDDHEITEWEWTWMKDASVESKAVDMQKTRTPFLELSNLEIGVYTFVLKVTDAKQQFSTSTVHVFVKPPTNLPPVAKAGNNITITLPQNWIMLNGSESTDDIKITNFYWRQIFGPNNAMLLNENTTVANATALTVGEYIFELFVIDESNNTNSDRVKVTVTQEKNAAPIANAGGDQTLTLPLSAIILNGTKSSDDLGITNYSWTRESSSLAIGTIIGNSDHEAILMLTSVVPGRYQFKLTVWDAQGVSSSDSCSVIVHADPNVMNLIELTLTMEAIVLTQSELESLQQKLELLLGDDVKLHMRELKIEQKTGQVIMVFYVEILNSKTGNLEIMTALDAERILKEKFWRDYTILGASIAGIRTAICQNNCSGHGQCNHETRACMCETFWMPSLFYFWGVTDANCDWSILYVIIGVFVIFLILSGICWSITCLCRRRASLVTKVHSSRISSRKKPQKYALLETNDAEDVTAFSRATISEESETEDSDVLFESRTSRPLNGILRNGSSNPANVDRNGHPKYSTTRLGRRIKT